MNNTNTKNNRNSEEPLVSSSVIAKRYNVSSRYILKLAADGDIPCVRIGKKCVRFDAIAVAKQLEGEDLN